MTRNPAHPNAAIVFVNWILSKDGHSVYVKSILLPGARVDAPTEGLDENIIYKPGKKYVYADESYFTLQRKLLSMSKKIFSPLMK